jgi:hypothetical protein
MKRLFVPLALIVGLSGAPGLMASHNSDEHSPNMSLLSNFDENGSEGSDIAFWGKRAIAGNFGSPGGFRILDISDPRNLKEIGQFECPGSQADVSVWKNLAFVSVDGPRTGPECGAPGANQAQVAAGQAWEGIRVVDISNPQAPRQIAAVHTDCGSHTHTLIPDLRRNRLIIYNSSYPLTGHYPRHEEERECGLGASPAHQEISVVEVPLSNPASASVVAEPNVGPGTIGCHDITVLMRERLAAAACISHSQIWDISNLTHPRILSRIVNPAINIHHSSAWSWDGNTVILGDELAGALATPGCSGSSDPPVGALWFYDVSNPSSPELESSWRIPRSRPSQLCTAHNFNVIPLRTNKDILVSAWYQGGTTVVDFTDPANPVEIGFYRPTTPVQATSWSSYWYNGYIYSNNYDNEVNGLLPGRGFDVLSISHPDINGKWKFQPYHNPQTQE